MSQKGLQPLVITKKSLVCLLVWCMKQNILGFTMEKVIQKDEMLAIKRQIEFLNLLLNLIQEISIKRNYVKSK